MFLHSLRKWGLSFTALHRFLQVIFLFPDYTNYLVTFSSVRLGWPTFATWGQNYGEIEGKLTELSCIILCMLLGATRCIHHFTGFVRSPASLLLNSYTRYMICDIIYICHTYLDGLLSQHRWHCCILMYYIQQSPLNGLFYTPGFYIILRHPWILDGGLAPTSS